MAVQSINISPSLAYVLNRAGDKSGVDFDYLLQTAMRESSLNPQAKASTSSAVGLFQFLDQTWFEVMKSDGGRLGYAEYANAIEMKPDGDLNIANPKLRAEVLKLREDPQVAADMAAAFTRSNGAYLQDKFGRMPSPGELYIAHFLGARGAEKMFEAGLSNPDQIAAKLFPRQAEANRSIFFDQGNARTIRDVYRVLVSKHDLGSSGASGFTAQQLATQQINPAEAYIPLPMSFDSFFATSASGASGSPVQPEAAGNAGFFAQLFGN